MRASASAWARPSRATSRRTCSSAEQAVDDHEVEIRLVARFEEQRNVGDASTRPGRKRGEPTLDGAIHDGVDDSLEILTCLRIAEHDPAEGTPVDGPVSRENGFAKSIEDEAFALAPGRDGLAGETIRVDSGNASRCHSCEHV